MTFQEKSLCPGFALKKGLKDMTKDMRIYCYKEMEGNYLVKYPITQSCYPLPLQMQLSSPLLWFRLKENNCRCHYG